jgi:hypothetical protein
MIIEQRRGFEWGQHSQFCRGNRHDSPHSHRHHLDTLVTPDDHSAMGVDFGILTSVISDAESIFNGLFH